MENDSFHCGKFLDNWSLCAKYFSIRTIIDFFSFTLTSLWARLILLNIFTLWGHSDVITSTLLYVIVPLFLHEIAPFCIISYSTNTSSFLYCYFIYVYIVHNNSIYFLVLSCSCQKSGLHKPYNKFTWHWVLTSFMGYLNIPTLKEKIILVI